MTKRSTIRRINRDESIKSAGTQYIAYWDGKPQYTGAHEIALLTAEDGATRGHDTAVVRKGVIADA